MIPTPQQLEEIARRREGNLQETPFSSLLCAFATQRKTAVLEIRRRQVWKKIVLDEGVPVDCRSNLVHETLGRYMVLGGKLSEEDFTACLSRSAARGVLLGEVLIEAGLVNAVDLFKILQQNLAKKLLDVFTWRDAEFHVVEDDLRNKLSLKVKVPQLILTGVTKLVPQEEVDMSVASLVGKRLALHPAPLFPLDDIRLTQRQAQLAEAIKPGRRMGELAESTGLPVDEITRLLYALSILGVVVPADTLPRDAPPPVLKTTGSFPLVSSGQAPAAAVPAATAVPPAASSAAAPQPAAGPQAPAAADLECRRNEIMQTYLDYRRQDSFDLLGVPETAPAGAIEEKFLEFSRRFAPWDLEGPELRALEDRARELFLAGARAFAELADTEQRNTLLFRRKNLREERAKKPGAFGGIKTDLLDSEAQFKKGQALMEQGKYKDAVLLLEFAADCDPQNSLYATELAYCRFLHSSAHADQAVRELQETLRRDPSCGLAAYYAGEISRETGFYEDAESYFRRAIRLMSPDRRPIDALKNLSTARRR
ncbi:MAG TPA: DUF4388 domain-containing protein [Thermoanaerobaculia bacterium]|nr:DUF4388 domain-containing protein [Thermoanaerobaculia bacterium]